MKTHVDSSQTYPCNICGKEFKRADHRKRHEESPSSFLVFGGEPGDGACFPFY
jgi:uncharacterized Zn-finger protein